MHGAVETNGYLFRRQGAKSLAYIPDVKALPEETMALLEEIDVLIIDALHFRQHPTHLTVEESLEVIAMVKPRQAYLMHCSHEIDHVTLENELPAHIRVAYDMLVLDL
jgi:phosphoribosyl 1,2-cyclic phosphate phosphodiesterase